MFTGLSAFPLTPVADDGIDGPAFAGLVQRLAAARVDSITALGSTGSYPYLTREERAHATRLAVQHAGDIPVAVGIGALRTRHVLELAEDAQHAGVGGVLLAPVSYQALTEDDVFGLYEDVTANLSVPLVVYDNPGTTHFTFSDELYVRIAELPHVASIKIPGVPTSPDQSPNRPPPRAASADGDRGSQRRRPRRDRAHRRMPRLVLGHRRHPARTRTGDHPRCPGRRQGLRHHDFAAATAVVGPVRPPRQPARDLRNRRADRPGRAPHPATTDPRARRR